MNLEILFNPRGVAVIGASGDPKKMGHFLLQNLKTNKKIKIYPINPGEKKILGVVCYPSVKAVPGKIDLALIAVPAPIVATVLKECGEKKISHVIVISAGFKEAGAEGLKREKELKDIAKKYKINLLGPNCLGVMDVYHNLNASFGGDLPAPGGLAFVSQSGAMGTATLDWAKKEKIGFSKFVSLGNEAGLTENDFIEYLSRDPHTKAILLYLEAVTDGKRFVRLAKKITPKKPIVVLKAGKSERGVKAVGSHTGSLAPESKIFELACEESGIISLDSLSEIFGVIKVFQSGILKPVRDWTVLTNGGGPSIVASDLIENSSHLQLNDLSVETKNKLRKILPKAAAVNNPVDIIGDALTDRYKNSLDILCQDKKVGGIIVMLTPQKMTEITKTAEILKNYKRKKPIVAVFIGGAAMDEAKRVFIKNKIANFTCPGKAIKAINYLHVGPPKIAGSVVAKARHAKPEKSWDFLSSQKILKNAGISLSGVFCPSSAQLAAKLKGIKYPIAMKVVSDEVLHKSDAGGVKVNIKDLAEAKKAWQDITKNVKRHVPKAIIKGIVAQPMAKGHEIIVGMKRDPMFGPVVVVGAGGIYVEILKDSVMGMPPISEAKAKAMIKRLKIAPILLGARGEKPANIAALAKIVTAVSRLSLSHPEIKEIDLNPIIMNEKKAEVVDWRIIEDSRD